MEHEVLEPSNANPKSAIAKMLLSRVPFHLSATNFRHPKTCPKEEMPMFRGILYLPDNEAEDYSTPESYYPKHVIGLTW
jgi:hypothetical protein